MPVSIEPVSLLRRSEYSPFSVAAVSDSSTVMSMRSVARWIAIGIDSVIEEPGLQSVEGDVGRDQRGEFVREDRAVLRTIAPHPSHPRFVSFRSAASCSSSTVLKLKYDFPCIRFFSSGSPVSCTHDRFLRIRRQHAAQLCEPLHRSQPPSVSLPSRTT